MDVDVNLYDDLTSLITPPDEDYCLDDLDEILRSTDSNLDSSIDFNAFLPSILNDIQTSSLKSITTTTATSINDGYKNEMHDESSSYEMYGYQSSPATNQSPALTPPYTSQRTSSTSSMDGDFFNPDDFLNSSYASDIMNLNEFTCDSMMELKQRNTPSPTGSCSSSGDSSTSGVQSDASSVTSMTKIEVEKDVTNSTGIAAFPIVENISFDIKDEIQNNIFATPAPPAVTTATKTTASNKLVTGTNSLLPISVPLQTVQQQQQQQQQQPTIISPNSVQPLNVMPGTIIPIKSVPLTSIKTPTTVKVEPKFVTKVSSAATGINATTKSANISNSSSNGSATTTSATTKPKTIYLSTNDFKALMQKMNSNQKLGTSTTIGNQIPKIIMKSPNGKMLTTASKIIHPVTNTVATRQTLTTPIGGNNNAHRIVKTNATGGLVLKQQQPTKVFATNTHTQLSATINTTTTTASAVSATGTTNRTPLDHQHRFFKGVIDEKMYKKQQRMIKNRESASLSRKKKKEYVTSLESRINNLEKENCTLKGENSSLRSQLAAFAQTCQCKNSNMSDFILHSLNMKSECTSSTQHVKIAPKPALKNIKPRLTAASVKKNVAVLFAMAFMVTMNIGNFQTYFNKNTIENSADATAAATSGEDATGSASVATGRHLLWVESESEFNEKLNRNKRDAELEVPPLTFFHPVNRSEQQLYNNKTTKEKPPSITKCTGGSNQTENLRLARDLHKWIDGNDYLNLSFHEKFKNVVAKDNTLRFGMSDELFNLKTIDLPLQGANGGRRVKSGEKRNFVVSDNDEEQKHLRRKQQKLNTNFNANNDLDSDVSDVDDYDDAGDDDDDGDDDGNESGKNSLDFFKPKISDEYKRLFKNIKRQDDTFYVLSFNMDHILLPASAYNKSSRPKMSLMLPAGDPTMNGDIVLMQIDCEVVNTTELELKSHMIPEKLRPIKFRNVNLYPTKINTSNNFANNETNADEKQTKKNGAKILQKSSATTAGLKATKVVDEQSRMKPIVRTVSLVGPKYQDIETIKRKPTIIKLSSNDSVIGSGVFKINNSMLFSKMRETVVGNNSGAP